MNKIKSITKNELWKRSVKILETDSTFKELDIGSWISQEKSEFEKKILATEKSIEEKNNIEKNLLFGDIPYTHQEIADSLAISRVTVTKVLNQFKDEGLISIEYGHIKVLKRDKLYEQYLSTLV